MPEPEDRAAALAHATRDLPRESVRETLARAASHAVDLVTGCDAASIAEVGDAGVLTLASSDAMAVTGDRLQAGFGAGPCFEVGDGRTRAFRVADLNAAPARWAPFAEAAARAGIAGVMALALRVPGETLGVLTVYSRRRDALTSESKRTGTLLASHVAVAYAAARAGEQLRSAMTADQEVAEAVGILIERHRLTKTEAFAMLTKASRDLDVALPELARRTAETGETPRSSGRR